MTHIEFIGFLKENIPYKLSIGRISGREANILKMRNGIDQEACTYRVVATAFNLSPSRVSQIHDKALRKLKIEESEQSILRLNKKCILKSEFPLQPYELVSGSDLQRIQASLKGRIGTMKAQEEAFNICMKMLKENKKELKKILRWVDILVNEECP